MIVVAEGSNVRSKELMMHELTVRQVHLRSLAAACATCHGAHGNSSGNVANLAGMDSKYFITQMLVFKSGERAATVMHHYAKGLDSEEITDLAEYFSAQILETPVVLHPQKLLVQSAN